MDWYQSIDVGLKGLLLLVLFYGGKILREQIKALKSTVSAQSTLIHSMESFVNLFDISK